MKLFALPILAGVGAFTMLFGSSADGVAPGLMPLTTDAAAELRGGEVCPVTYVKVCGHATDCDVVVWCYWNTRPDPYQGLAPKNRKAGGLFTCGDLDACGQVRKKDWCVDSDDPDQG